MNGTKDSLVKILGQENVLDDPEILDNYKNDNSSGMNIKPWFVVKPAEVGQIQEVVKWANETKTPLIPVSSGAPHIRGDSAPSLPEAVIVDLTKMKKILKINRRNRLAVIEPGVTYSELQPALEKEGMRLITPLLPRMNKSVIASLLEREPIVSPRFQWNMMDPLRSLEIIWGNGDKLWSGSGGFRSLKEEDWEKGIVPATGPGPAQVDYYRLISGAQGSMGIVTWASVKCEVLPSYRKLFFVPSNNINSLIDFTYKLLRFRFGDELFIINNAYFANILSKNSDETESLKSILPEWAVIIGITGGEILPKEKVEGQEADIRDIAQQFGLKLENQIGECRSQDFYEILQKPSENPYWKIRSKGSMKEIFFMTTMDKTPDFIIKMSNKAKEHQYPVSDIGVYLQPAHQGVSCHCEFILPVNNKDGSEILKSEKLFNDASIVIQNQGAYFSRPYGIWSEMTYNRDARTTITMKKIKDIFDPNHIMNPHKLCF